MSKRRKAPWWIDQVTWRISSGAEAGDVALWSSRFRRARSKRDGFRGRGFAPGDYGRMVGLGEFVVTRLARVLWILERASLVSLDWASNSMWGRWNRSASW